MVAGQPKQTMAMPPLLLHGSAAPCASSSVEYIHNSRMRWLFCVYPAHGDGVLARHLALRLLPRMHERRQTNSNQTAGVHQAGRVIAALLTEIRC